MAQFSRRSDQLDRHAALGRADRPGIGLLTLFVGMILLFPVLGYATWHSDRRLVA
jgi:hypothetical protein